MHHAPHGPLVPTASVPGMLWGPGQSQCCVLLFLTRSRHVGPGICVPPTPCLLRAETVGLHPWALLSQHFGCCLGWGQERGLSSLTLSLCSSPLLASLGLCSSWPQGEQHREIAEVSGRLRQKRPASAVSTAVCVLEPEASAEPQFSGRALSRPEGKSLRPLARC